MVVVGSYRKGIWKLIADGHRGRGGNPEATAHYDIDNDVVEKADLVKSKPEKTKALLAEHREFWLSRALKSQPKNPITKSPKPARRKEKEKTNAQKNQLRRLRVKPRPRHRKAAARPIARWFPKALKRHWYQDWNPG
ncbi:MAG: hypothetical protein ACI9MB_004534, partial [Verrucomicrobiales bacterium]